MIDWSFTGHAFASEASSKHTCIPYELSLQSKIKKQFFRGLGSFTLCQVKKNDKIQEDFQEEKYPGSSNETLLMTDTMSEENCNYIVHKETFREKGKIEDSYTNHLELEDKDYCHQCKRNLEFNCNEKSTSIVMVDVDEHNNNDSKGSEEPLLGCLDNLTLEQSPNYLQSSTITDQDSRSTESIFWSNNSLDYSMVYVADINSNLSNSGSCFGQDVSDINTVAIRKVPTLQLLQNKIGNLESLSLESEEIALAVHQEFFNGN